MTFGEQSDGNVSALSFSEKPGTSSQHRGMKDLDDLSGNRTRNLHMYDNRHLLQLRYQTFCSNFAKMCRIVYLEELASGTSLRTLV